MPPGNYYSRLRDRSDVEAVHDSILPRTLYGGFQPTQLRRCPFREVGFGSSVDAGFLSLRYGPAVHPRSSTSGDKANQSESTGGGCPVHRPVITRATDSYSPNAMAPASADPSRRTT